MDELLMRLWQHRHTTDQVAIVTLNDNTRITARIEGDRVQIGDAVEECEPRSGIPYFRKSKPQ